MAVDAGSSANGDDSEVDRRLAALHRWRSEAVADGNTTAGQLKDSDLKLIARSLAVRLEEVRKQLRPAHADLAKEIAPLLAAVSDEPAAEPVLSVAPSDPADPFPDGAVPEFAQPDSGPHPQPASAVTVSSTNSGLALSWPPMQTDAATVIYRLVAKDGTASWAPESPGTVEVAVTTACHATDDRPFSRARRYLDVWVHAGPTPEQAARSAPVRHAHAMVIAPVTDVRLAQAEDRVVGQWTTPEDAVGVDVLRIPIDEVPAGCGDPRYQLPPEAHTRNGLDDTGVIRGQGYLYEIRTVAEDHDGHLRHSAPARVELQVEAALRPVLDLTARLEGSDEVTLGWSHPPAGQVHVYRTEREPVGGAGRTPIPHDERALEEMRLPAADRQLHPVRDEGPGRAVMPRVPWPPGWTRAYFTPVTVLGGRAHVGATVRIVRTGTVTHPRIVERVHRELLTFGWPEGADAVWLYQGVSGQDQASAISGQPTRAVMRERYAHEGGMHLDPPLPAQGCSVHLVPVAFDAGRPERGPATSLNYPGLLRMRYTITARRNMFGALVAFTVWLRSEVELNKPPAFVLVYNPDRLPLEIGDGQPVPVTAAWASNAEPVVRIVPPPMHAGVNPDLGWTADARQWRGGYLRLFPDMDERHRALVALQDPPVPELCLLPQSRRQGPW